MSSYSPMTVNRKVGGTALAAVTAFVVLTGCPTGLLLAQGALDAAQQPAHRRDQQVELALKIRAPFTVVAVGDMLQMMPIARSSDANVQFLLDLMRGADLTLANNENTVVDHDTFGGVISHMEAPPAVAADWAAMGIDIMTKANNHTWDDGDEGLWQDFRELSRVGIVHVGADRNEVEARMARAVSTPKGTAGMVGIYTENETGQLMGLPLGRKPYTVTPTQLQQLRAMRDAIVARRNEVPVPISMPAPDKPGEVLVFGVLFRAGTGAAGDVDAGDLDRRLEESRTRRGKIETRSNTVHLETYNGVTREQMKQLRTIAGETGTGDTLSAFGVKFRVMAGPGEYTYEMDAQQERDMLREIRSGKQFYDFMAATVHWHQNRFAFQHYSFDHYPADFQVRMAHEAIDQGADLFFAHGVHTLKGIEIYNGKPIFYGISNFVLQEQMFRSWRDQGVRQAASPTGPLVGEGEENEQKWAWMEKSPNYEALLASSHYENGRLTEVKVYPVDLGVPERPGSQMGIPRRPSAERAREILTRVVEYSKPFGTRMAIEDGVGIIRLDQSAPAERRAVRP